MWPWSLLGPRSIFSSTWKTQAALAPLGISAQQQPSPSRPRSWEGLRCLPSLLQGPLPILKWKPLSSPPSLPSSLCTQPKNLNFTCNITPSLSSGKRSTVLSVMCRSTCQTLLWDSVKSLVGSWSWGNRDQSMTMLAWVFFSRQCRYGDGVNQGLEWIRAAQCGQWTSWSPSPRRWVQGRGPWNNRGDWVVWVMVVQRRSLESSTRVEGIADGYSGSLIKRIQWLIRCLRVGRRADFCGKEKWRAETEIEKGKWTEKKGKEILTGL